MNENVSETVGTEETVETTPVIDLDALDKANEPEEEKSESEILKEQLAEQKRLTKEAEDRAKKFKNAFDNKASEAAAKSREARDLSEQLEQPNEELEELRQELEARKLTERKHELTLAITDQMGISQESALGIVGAVFDPETGEVNIPELVSSFTTVINDVRKLSEQKGYESRDHEMATGLQRNYSKNKDKTIFDEKLDNYVDRYKR